MADISNKTVAILQSSYIPWKGYFDIIRQVDEFIFLDDVQFTKNDWRNRNQIKTLNGLKWLTIPILHGGSLKLSINQTKTASNDWAVNHWKTISNSYGKAPFFRLYKDQFEHLYNNILSSDLSTINYKFINLIIKILGIQTKLSWSTDYKKEGKKSERLISICKQSGSNTYLSGPAAKSYLDEDLFRQENIKVKWMDYNNYPEYPQLYPPFEHHVSVLDLIFNTGPNANKCLKHMD